MSNQNGNGWLVYMIRCDDDSLYTGITTDIARRWQEHGGNDQQLGGRGKVAKKSGAKFFRGRKPLQLAYIECGHDRGSAMRREAAIKRLPRAAKLILLKTIFNELHTLDRALLSMLGY